MQIKQEIASLVKQSWSISWPMVIFVFCDFLMMLTDVFIAGLLGKEIQAAYGIAIQIFFIFSIIGKAITTGTIAIVSRLFTQPHAHKELATAIYSSTVAVLVAGTILSIAGILLSPWLIQFLTIPEELKPYVSQLIVIYASGLAFYYVLFNINGVLRATKRVLSSLQIMFIATILNIILNFVFVFTTGAHFLGIAISTSLSVLLASLLNLRLIQNDYSTMTIVNMAQLKKIFKISWPSGLLQVLWQLGSVLLILVISQLPEYPVEAIAALTNGLRIEAAVYMPAFAFNLANAVIIGNYLGSSQQNEAYRSGFITAGMGMIIVITLTILVIVFAPMLSNMLSDNPIVIDETIRYLYISMLLEPVLAWGMILAGGLNGAGDTRSVMLFVAIPIWFVRLPLSYFFGIVLGYGIVAIWWSMNASIIVQTSFMTIRYVRKKWLSVDIN